MKAIDSLIYHYQELLAVTEHSLQGPVFSEVLLNRLKVRKEEYSVIIGNLTKLKEELTPNIMEHQYQIFRREDGTEFNSGDYDIDGNMLHYCERCYGWQFYQVDIPSKSIIFCHNCEGNFTIHDIIDEFTPINNFYNLKDETDNPVK